MRKYEVLKRYFGYSTFREGQEQLVDAILLGRDVLGIMPTGSGKSICYQVPALMFAGITLVISPLISLMQDQVQSLNQQGARAAYINSSLKESQISLALEYAKLGKYKIIYVAPERLETDNFLSFACNANIAMIAIDEAHCISQWGQDFRPSYLNIVDFIHKLPARPVIGAFTATATDTVKEDIKNILHLNDPVQIVTGYDRKNLFFAVENPKDKENYVISYVKKHIDQSGIIYCNTRKNVEVLYEALFNAEISVTRYHAGLSNAERKKNQEDFIYDRSPVMVATNAFGMGIDKSNVRYVLHYNMPQSLENYYQEAGRAGRDGERAECILLYSAQDVIINRFLIEKREENPNMDGEQQETAIQQDLLRLSLMNDYCMQRNCLRFYLLRYFGEKHYGRCMNCSNCLQEYDEIDATNEAKQVIRCIQELPHGYGIYVVTATLVGANEKRILDYRLHQQPSFGILKEMGRSKVKELIQQMVQYEYLTVTPDQYALLKITDKGRDLMRNQNEKVLLQIPKKTEEEANEKYEPVIRKKTVLNTEGTVLFDQLRALRVEIASKEGLPPYMIFSDKTLTDMCVKLPFTREEMLEVNGVGDRKYEKYGELFRKKIIEYTGGEKKKLSSVQIETKEPSKQSGKWGRKEEFSLTPEQAESFEYGDSLLAPQIAERMSALRDPDRMKKIYGADIFRWIQSEGLADRAKIDDKWTPSVSESGKLAGISLGERTSQKGVEYTDIYYNRDAQKMIIDHYIKNDK